MPRLARPPCRRPARSLRVVAGLLGAVAAGVLLVLVSGHPVVAAAYVLGAGTTALCLATAAGEERSSSRHLPELLDALHVVVYELDATTREVRYVSPHIRTLTGQAADDLLGDPAPLLSSAHPADVAPLLAFVERTCREGRTCSLDYRVVTTDGEVKWVRNTASVAAASGRPLLRGCVADITSQKQAELALAEQARTDGLTGLANRADLLAALARCCEPGAAGTPRLLAFLDLDSFKRINDSLGHAAGDALLAEVAARLSAAVRAEDVVARLGGDEFVVLMALEQACDAEGVVSRLLASFDAPFQVGGRPLQVTASAGAVVVAAGTAGSGAAAGTAGSGAAAGTAGHGAEALLECADAAMYEAKRAGRGRHAFYNEAMRAAALSRLDIESDLSTALDEGQFVLHYQPIVGAADGVLLGHEALVRWQHPERGLVPPSAFIEIAEATGQIVELGRWTLHEACRQARRWGGSTPLTVSVNLSGRQLDDPDLVSDVATALHAADLTAGSLTLEVTETALVTSSSQALTTLRALRAIGVTVALDDFGTGYSSLSHLHRYPVDIVKIDRSFVHGVDDPGSDAHGIVSAILGLASHMHLTVTAEGVETREQADALVALGCDRLQGYYLGRPAAPPALALPRPRDAEHDASDAGTARPRRPSVTCAG